MRPLLAAVPFFRAPELVERAVRPLIACAAELHALDADVQLIDDSPDHSALAEALAAVLPDAAAAFPCRVVSNPRNLGFLASVNLLLHQAAARGADALLLNSDAVVFPGALTEMARVMRADPRAGLVSPRSNNATLASLPAGEAARVRGPEAAERAWRAIAPRLHPASDVPTVVGFCLLLRWEVLRDCGGFDPVYGAGYCEENDLAMRAVAFGWRAVLANQAFVWHEGERSFAATGTSRAEREAANRRVLLARHPAYTRLVRDHFASPGYIEELALALATDPEARLDDLASEAARASGRPLNQVRRALADALRLAREL